MPNNLKTRRLRKVTARGQIASAIGWLNHGNCYNFSIRCKVAYLCELLGVYKEKLVKMNHIEDLLEPVDQIGTILPMSILVNKPVIFLGSDLFTKKDSTYLRISYHLLNSNKEKPILYISFSKSEVLIKLFEKYKEYLPFDGMITKINNWYSLVPSNWSINMKGFPSHLNTKADYEYIKNNFEKSLWLPEFQKLLDSRKDWFFVKDLDKEADGVTDDTHKVVSFQQEKDGPVSYSQYELKENPTAKIFRIGYTQKEVEDIIANA